MDRRFSLFLVLLLISTSVLAERTLVLGRAPQLSASTISQQWSPFVRHLSEATGTKIILKVYHDRSEFEGDVKDGKVDLYFGNPGYGIVGHLRHGYIPLVRSDRKLLEGIVVVKKESGIESIQQLSDKRIAFPAETAFAASLYIRSRLDSDFKIAYQPFYVGSHDNTYRTVLVGKAAAGGGVKRTLESEPRRIREQLQIIYTTPGMKPHPLMAHPRVPENIRKSIQKAIVDLNKDDAGKKLLKTVKLQKPVIADYTQDYQPIEPFVTKMYKYLLD